LRNSKRCILTIHLGDLTMMYALSCVLIGKVIDFLLVLIELLSLSVTDALRCKMCQFGAFSNKVY